MFAESVMGATTRTPNDRPHGACCIRGPTPPEKGLRKKKKAQGKRGNNMILIILFVIT